MGDDVLTFGLTLCRDRLGLESMKLRSMRHAVHSVSRDAVNHFKMMIIRIVKDHLMCMSQI